MATMPKSGREHFPPNQISRYKKKKAIQVVRQVGKGDPNCDIETASVKVVQRTSSLGQAFFSV